MGMEIWDMGGHEIWALMIRCIRMLLGRSSRNMATRLSMEAGGRDHGRGLIADRNLMHQRKERGVRAGALAWEVTSKCISPVSGRGSDSKHVSVAWGTAWKSCIMRP